MATEHADTREYLVVHQTLRVLLSRFVNATERIDPSVLATVLPSRWALFARGLHHHHEVEDTMFFPVVVRDRPDMKALVDELELQHQQLVARLDAVDTAVAALAAGPGDASRAAAHDAIKAVRDELVPHLDVEDAQLLPAAAEAVDGAEWKKISEQALRSLDKKDLPVVAGALDEVARGLPKDQRPPPPPLMVRVLVSVSWRKRYEQFIEPLVT